MGGLFFLILSILTQVTAFQFSSNVRTLIVFQQMSEQCGPDPPTTTTPPPPPPPPQPCEWAEWEEWSGCSATCGGGKRGRTRGISIEAECGGLPCSGDVREIGDCNEDVCECEFHRVPFGYSDTFGNALECQCNRRLLCSHVFTTSCHSL